MGAIFPWAISGPSRIFQTHNDARTGSGCGFNTAGAPDRFGSFPDRDQTQAERFSARARSKWIESNAIVLSLMEKVIPPES